MVNTSIMLPLLLQSAVLPFALTLAVLLLLRRPGPAIAAGFLASYFAVFHAQWSPLPKVALDWMPWIAVSAVPAALLLRRLPLQFLFALGAAAVLVWPARASLGDGMAAAAAGASALLILLAWRLAARADQTSARAPLLQMVVAGGAGLALMLDSSQAIGQLSGALAASLAACGVVVLRGKPQAYDQTAAGVAQLLLGTLLTAAWLYAGFPLPYVALLAAALFVPALLPTWQDRAPMLRRGLPALLAIVPVAVVIGLALKAAQEYGGY
jgi:hypothetical protein